MLCRALRFVLFFSFFAAILSRLANDASSETCSVESGCSENSTEIGGLPMHWPFHPHWASNTETFGRIKHALAMGQVVVIHPAMEENVADQMRKELMASWMPTKNGMRRHYNLVGNHDLLVDETLFEHSRAKKNCTIIARLEEGGHGFQYHHHNMNLPNRQAGVLIKNMSRWLKEKFQTPSMHALVDELLAETKPGPGSGKALPSLKGKTLKKAMKRLKTQKRGNLSEVLALPLLSSSNDQLQKLAQAASNVGYTAGEINGAINDFLNHLGHEARRTKKYQWKPSVVRIHTTGTHYDSGDFSFPHNDCGYNRLLSYNIHLSQVPGGEWLDDWGGGLVWCDPYTVIPPRFNQIVLFVVRSHTNHHVSMTTAKARAAGAARLALTGWFEGERVEESEYIGYKELWCNEPMIPAENGMETVVHFER